MIKQFDTIEIMEGYISSKIHGAFSIMDMYVLSDYVKRLQAGDQYVEIGVDFGKSAATAVFQAPDGVTFMWIDIVDRQKPDGYPNLLSRAEFFASEGLNSVGTFIRDDANHVAQSWNKKVSMMFIDGDHTEHGCSNDIVNWFPHMKSGGYMLFHDYDQATSPGVVQAVNGLVRDSGLFDDFFIGRERFAMATSIVGARKI